MGFPRSSEVESGGTISPNDPAASILPYPAERLRIDARTVQRRRRVGDELLARRHLVPHQQVEDLLRGFQVGDVDAAQGAVARVHRGLGQLVGVHLTKALV